MRIFLGVLMLAVGAQAYAAKVRPLISEAVVIAPWKEVVMIEVEYPPGYEGEIHRHNAQSFIYVLEGSVVMQVRGGKEVILEVGQTFYEAPADVHVVGRNASRSKPARLIVVLLKDAGAPIVIPAT